ncbi:hypothetical protein H5410_064363, partial [Solanum commersonii]
QRWQTVMNLLVESLFQLITDKIELIGGAKDELDNLLQEINTLKAFLQDNDQQESNSNLWKIFVKIIRTQAHKADDVIDKFVLEAKLHEEKNLWEKALDWRRHIKRVNNLAKGIKAIRERVKEIRQNNPQVLQPTPMVKLRKRLAREPQAIVVMEEEEEAVEEEEVTVIEEEENRGGRMHTYCGYDWTCKTTLARKVWSDSQITAEFSHNIWVSVGLSNELKNKFFVILKSSTGSNEEFHCNGENELGKLIAIFVTEQHRCLIVLDDVWAKMWQLAVQVKNLIISSVSTEDSFQLLEKGVFDNERCRNNDLVDLGKSIASKCGGLPLALVVVAKALKVNQTVYEWKRIENNFWQYVVKENDTTSCWKIVEASYENVDSLVDGGGANRVKSKKFSSSKDKAENYLMEFENLDLVIVSREITGSIKRIKCNDIFYEFYKMEATKESVFQELRLKPVFPSINDADTSRRLHIESCDLSDFVSRIPSAEHVRSFLCFSSKDLDQQTKLSSDVDIQLIQKAFPLLRVLIIESINIPSLKNLNQLFHLRYISISGNFKELPAFFSKFRSLQSIIINTSQPTLNIKANIWNMSKLTHLKTNKPSKLPLPSTQKGKGSSSVQTLSKISPETCNKDVLGEASNSLKKLSIQGNIEDSLKTNSTFEGFQTFEKFECLENLKLMSDARCDSNDFQLPKALFRFLLKLKKLTLSKTMFGSIWKPEEGDFRKLQILLIHNEELQIWKAIGCHFRELRVLVLECPKLESVPAELSQFQQQSIITGPENML